MNVDTASNNGIGRAQPREQYDPERYWSDRHRRYRHSFRGVGNSSRSEEENIRDYADAVETVAPVFRTVGFNPARRSALDIGCGNGFWTAVLKNWGISTYTGIDITDVMFDLLRERHPDAEFLRGRLPDLPIHGPFELITMIDVSQHIIDDMELGKILRCIPSLLAQDGIFLVTFWNVLKPQEDAHEKFRLFEFYTSALAGIAHTQPTRFRDKFIAVFYKHPAFGAVRLPAIRG